MITTRYRRPGLREGMKVRPDVPDRLMDAMFTFVDKRTSPSFPSLFRRLAVILGHG